MTLYRRRSAPVEAWVISGVIDLYNHYELPDVLAKATDEGRLIIHPTYIVVVYNIVDPSDSIMGSPKDILIKDANGNLSICNRQTFNQTYERIDEW